MLLASILIFNLYNLCTRLFEARYTIGTQFDHKATGVLHFYLLRASSSDSKTPIIYLLSEPMLITVGT